MASDSWDAIPWERETHAKTSFFRKHHVPYVIPKGNDLQNLDVWIPASGDQPLPAASALPSSQEGLWVIFIHGGAWRDPTVTSSSFEPTVRNLGARHAGDIFSFISSSSSSSTTTTSDRTGGGQKIVGIASLNYSLTPKFEDDRDPAHQATHPDHILDVLRGLAYLQSRAGFGSRYLLLGHSCGATLTLQVAMRRSRWARSPPSHSSSSSAAASASPSTGEAPPSVAKPIAIIGLNGLYDMLALVCSPGREHAHLREVYEEFVRKAFGDEEAVWREISPSFVDDWGAEWEEGTSVVLVQSRQDSLVSYEQLEAMRRSLLASRGSGLVVGELEAGGDHNALWEEGDRLAEIVVEVLRGLK